jgi:hypothetical protein
MYSVTAVFNAVFVVNGTRSPHTSVGLVVVGDLLGLSVGLAVGVDVVGDLLGLAVVGSVVGTLFGVVVGLRVVVGAAVVGETLGLAVVGVNVVELKVSASAIRYRTLDF